MFFLFFILNSSRNRTLCILVVLLGHIIFSLEINGHTLIEGIWSSLHNFHLNMVSKHHLLSITPPLSPDPHQPQPPPPLLFSILTIISYAKPCCSHHLCLSPPSPFSPYLSLLLETSYLSSTDLQLSVLSSATLLCTILALLCSVFVVSYSYSDAVDLEVLILH